MVTSPNLNILASAVTASIVFRIGESVSAPPKCRTNRRAHTWMCGR
jgi:hypothetical protein